MKGSRDFRLVFPIFEEALLVFRSAPLKHRFRLWHAHAIEIDQPNEIVSIDQKVRRFHVIVRDAMSAERLPDVAHLFDDESKFVRVDIVFMRSDPIDKRLTFDPFCE